MKGKNPYNYETYNRAFSTNGALRVHEIIHEIKERFASDGDECRKPFRINKNLRHHRRIDQNLEAWSVSHSISEKAAVNGTKWETVQPGCQW